ncbi:MAG: hypothetical protein WKF78_10425 [Candidatus Limnocylindrales bacterium]
MPEVDDGQDREFGVRNGGQDRADLRFERRCGPDRSARAGACLRDGEIVPASLTRPLQGRCGGPS